MVSLPSSARRIQCDEQKSFSNLRKLALSYPQCFIFSRYSYMIDNIVLLVTGTMHQRPLSELLPKCHPLGSFEQMEAIHVASTPSELYNAVLVDTPLGTV